MADVPPKDESAPIRAGTRFPGGRVMPYLGQATQQGARREPALIKSTT